MEGYHTTRGKPPPASVIRLRWRESGRLLLQVFELDLNYIRVMDDDDEMLAYHERVMGEHAPIVFLSRRE